MGLNERVKAIEAKAGTQAGPIVIVYENDSIPQGTPPGCGDYLCEVRRKCQG